MEGRGGLGRILRGDDGVLRPPWRLLLYLAGAYALLLLLSPLMWWLGSMPFERLLAFQGLVALIVAVVVGWALYVWVEHRPRSALGFGLSRATPRDIGLGLVIGGAPILVCTALVALPGLIRYVQDGGGLADWLTAVAGDLATLAPPAAAEEALFRGYVFQTLVRWLGAVASTLILSIGFAWAHAGNPNVGPFAFANIFLAGVLLSAAYLLTRSLWFASAVHLGWNWAMASLLDLPVSGLSFFDTPLYEPVDRGPDWITGGEFGPEGGLLGTVAALVGIAAVIRWAPRPARKGSGG